MQKYTTDNPVFTEELPLLETTTPAHADNFNYINQQLFENTLYLNKQQKEQQTVTASDTTLGRVKLSSAVDEASDVDSGIAATPAAVKKAYNKATTAESIAKGKNRARVFNTTEDMNTWLSKAANKGVANVGDNLYIIELDVPDWWIAEVLEEPNESGLYYNIGKLETQKVDLTTIQAAIQKNTDDIGEISSNLSSLHIDSSNKQLATKSCSHGVYVDYFSYTPTKDTLVSLSTYLEAGALCNINGNVRLQLYSADTTKSFVNVVDNLNPYVANLGGLTLNIHHKFIAKAGVE